VILIDVNLLLYAYDSASLEHDRAAFWLDLSLSLFAIVGLLWHTIVSFLRISTSPKMIFRPRELDDAISIVSEWLERPNVSIVDPTEQHWQIFSKLLPRSRVRGSLIMDAHLAALAIEHGATLCTNDRDFARFPGLRVEYPLQQ
jgi:toxin-antitoxin system PIN domain toxin